MRSGVPAWGARWVRLSMAFALVLFWAPVTNAQGDAQP